MLEEVITDIPKKGSHRGTMSIRMTSLNWFVIGLNGMLASQRYRWEHGCRSFVAGTTRDMERDGLNEKTGVLVRGRAPATLGSDLWLDRKDDGTKGVISLTPSGRFMKPSC